MELKDVFAALEKAENGVEMIAAIKAETNRLSNEAKAHRMNGEKASGKVKNILEALGLTDGDDVIEQAKGMKDSLDTFAQGGKKPTEVAKQIADLTKQVTTLTNNYNEMTKTARAEKTKRLDAMKMSRAVDALTKGNAASPQSMAKLIFDNLTVGEDESIGYRDGDKDMSVEDGVNAWLSANTWAVKANPQDGSGSSAGGSGGADDPFLVGFEINGSDT